MLARTPRNRPAVPERPRQLRSDRRAALRGKIAAIMARAEPTPFAAEGSCLAGIRSALCLQGWRWSAAQEEAAEIVRGALRIVGAKRPDWKQGQPEWTQDGVFQLQYERCRNCLKPVPEGHFKFCCKTCSTVYSHRLSYRWHSEEESLRRKALRAAEAVSRRNARKPITCAYCGKDFKPTKTKTVQKYCSRECAGKLSGGAAKREFRCL